MYDHVQRFFVPIKFIYLSDNNMYILPESIIDLWCIFGALLYVWHGANMASKLQQRSPFNLLVFPEDCVGRELISSGVVPIL